MFIIYWTEKGDMTNEPSLLQKARYTVTPYLDPAVMTESGADFAERVRNIVNTGSVAGSKMNDLYTMSTVIETKVIEIGWPKDREQKLQTLAAAMLSQMSWSEIGTFWAAHYHYCIR